MEPRVIVTPAPPMRIDWDVPVIVRDGTILRVNVFRPSHAGRLPVIMSAHPYGKDKLPLRSRSGRAPNAQYRLFPQPRTVRFSALTGWEAPDPAFWVAHGYAVLNADLRGAGTSEGIGELLGEQEREDYHDLIEWAGTQPWCTGKVGLSGVSYLALSQYNVAVLRPAHLAAICPWEGFSDLYRDFLRPGGVREDGFSVVWSTGTRRAARIHGNLRREAVARPELDDYYRERTPQLERIDVPLLQCASFSDQSLHTRGSFEAFRRAGSERKWLYTHRDGKWCHFYSEPALGEQLRFFDHVLKDADNGWAGRAPVRIAVHEHGSAPAEILEAARWPPEWLRWTELHLDAAARMLSPVAPPRAAADELHTRTGRLTFTWSVPEDVDVIGPMALRLHVSLPEGGDASLFVAMRKRRGGREVTFEGSYGYGLDVVSRGWQRLAHRRLDAARSTPWQPVHAHDAVEPLAPGVPTPVQIAMLPHATRMRAGEQLVLEIQGRWIFPRDPLRGQFPAGYQRGRATVCRVHTGPAAASTLLLGVR